VNKVKNLLCMQLTFICLIFCSSTIHAQNIGECDNTKFSNTRLIKDLPSDIKTLVFEKFPGSGEISDSDGKFNSTDVGGGPRRRFLLAALSPNCVYVAVEHGGRGYFVEVWSFHRNSAGWTENVHNGADESDSLKNFSKEARKYGE
jgi:hypothetical protein